MREKPQRSDRAMLARPGGVCTRKNYVERRRGSVSRAIQSGRWREDSPRWARKPCSRGRPLVSFPSPPLALLVRGRTGDRPRLDQKPTHCERLSSGDAASPDKRLPTTRLLARRRPRGARRTGRGRAFRREPRRAPRDRPRAGRRRPPRGSVPGARLCRGQRSTAIEDQRRRRLSFAISSRRRLV